MDRAGLSPPPEHLVLHPYSLFLHPPKHGVAALLLLLLLLANDSGGALSAEKLKEGYFTGGQLLNRGLALLPSAIPIIF